MPADTPYDFPFARPFRLLEPDLNSPIVIRTERKHINELVDTLRELQMQIDTHSVDGDITDMANLCFQAQKTANKLKTELEKNPSGLEERSKVSPQDQFQKIVDESVPVGSVLPLKRRDEEEDEAPGENGARAGRAEQDTEVEPQDRECLSRTSAYRPDNPGPHDLKFFTPPRARPWH